MVQYSINDGQRWVFDFTLTRGSPGDAIRKIMQVQPPLSLTYSNVADHEIATTFVACKGNRRRRRGGQNTKSSKTREENKEKKEHKKGETQKKKEQ